MLGPRMSSDSFANSEASGSIKERYLRRSHPSRVATVASIECSSITAVPSSSGWAHGAVGSIQKIFMGSERKKGLATPKG
jgi:hypothetical protein